MNDVDSTKLGWPVAQPSYNTPIACNRATADFILSSHLMAEEYERIVPNFTRIIIAS